MELLYIYLGKIKDKSQSFVFENQGFKFTSEFDIDFDKDNNILKFDKNNNYCHDFYKINSNYTAPFNLTCIVGENGAGKTCLLELLKNVLKKKSLYLRNYNDYIIIWRKNNYIKYLNYNQKIKLVCDIDSKLFKINNEVHYDELYSDLKHLYKVYYSNYIDNSFIKDTLNDNKLFDISSKYLMFNNHLKKNNTSKTDDSLIPANYIKAEFGKKLYFFFNKFNFDFLSKYLKKEINDKFQRNNLNIHFNFFDFSLLYELYKNHLIILTLLRDIDNYITKKIRLLGSYKDQFLWRLAQSLCFICFYYIYYLFNHNLIVDGGLWKRKPFDDNFEINDFLKFSIAELLIILNSSSIIVKNEEIEPVYNISLKFFYIVESILYYPNCVFNKNNTINISFAKFNEADKNNIISKIQDLFYTYIDLLYYSDKELDNLIELSFSPRYSSGEDALITFFSRIFYLVKYDGDFKKVLDKEKYLYFLIDEAELGFHPQWCKEYVEILISYLQELFAEYNIHIHLIITTNNPIVLSDILSDDVIYLKNKETLNSDKQPKIAFCSNILDLYSDSFFIQDGLIGAFAKKKINQVIKFIKYNKQNKQEISDEKRNERIISREECEFIIENIGDSNIKGFLRGLFEDLKRKERL